MRKLLLLLTITLIAISAHGQNYIGVQKSQIFELVKQELNGFIFDNEVQNNYHHFIKFVNPIDEQTLIFVLDSYESCTSVLRMYNTWLYESIRKELKKNYTFVGPDTWIENKNGVKYKIALKKGEWFITVITSKYK